MYLHSCPLNVERHPRNKNIFHPNPIVLFYRDCTWCHHPWPTFWDALVHSCWVILRLEGVFVDAEKYFPNIMRFLEVSQCVFFLRFPNVWFGEEVSDCQCTILSVSHYFNCHCQWRTLTWYIGAGWDLAKSVSQNKPAEPCSSHQQIVFFGVMSFVDTVFGQNNVRLQCFV